MPDVSDGVLLARQLPPPLGQSLDHTSIDPSRWQLEPTARPLGASPALTPDAPDRGDWAVYLNAVHNKLHPIFAGQYLRSLRELPCDNPLSDWRLRVGVWLEIDRKTGDVTRLGISQPSGSSEFDAAALEAFLLAFPVEVPAAISGASDRVYINWDLCRDPERACNTYFAQPIAAPREEGDVQGRAP